jgi:UPF0755 protein
MGWFKGKSKYDEIEKWRKKIDKIDVKIVRLLNRRARYADEIGKIKQELNLPIYSPERENQIMENVTKHNFGPLSDMAIKRLYERIIDESRRLERESAEHRKLYPNINLNSKQFFNLKSSIKYFALLFILFFIQIINKQFFALDLPPTKFYIIEITKNSTFDKATEILNSNGLLKNKTLFFYAGKFLGLDKKVKAGRYILVDNLPMAIVMDEIVNPKYILTATVTIPEGLTARRIASILKAKVGIDSVRFMQLVNDPKFARNLGIDADGLEGYLMPDTYVFIWGDDEQSVIKKMVGEFQKFYSDTLKEREKVVGLNTHQVVTLASIVEGEAKFDDEKPRIAGVYFNRLKLKMPLEADPTIQYIIPDGPRRLLYQDLKIESPYNTYLNRGLPPGPVNNPGRSSILAVLYPERHKFLYFVSDGAGRHIFSRTYDEHLKAVRRYRKLILSKKQS